MPVTLCCCLHTGTDPTVSGYAFSSWLRVCTKAGRGPKAVRHSLAQALSSGLWEAPRAGSGTAGRWAGAAWCL